LKLPILAKNDNRKNNKPKILEKVMINNRGSIRKEKGDKTTKWRQKSEQFRAAMKAARSGGTAAIENLAE